MRGSKVAFFLQTFEIINKKIAINTDTLISSTDDGLSWSMKAKQSNSQFDFEIHSISGLAHLHGFPSRLQFEF